ncbi:MAG: S-layer homology domain-containing protein [Syntrophomonas sp.]|nr:S-layer homology domain-containing protein [Syntrophomonas sp.]
MKKVIRNSYRQGTSTKRRSGSAMACLCLSIIAAAVILITIPGMVTTVQAETVTIPNGDCTIAADGVYQLGEDYSGTITIDKAVTVVTVTDAVYKAHHDNTRIFAGSGRTSPLELTIEDLDIYYNYHLVLGGVYDVGNGIDLANASSGENKLYISGTCRVEADEEHAAINAIGGVQLTIDKAPGASEADLTAIVENYSAGGYSGGGAAIGSWIGPCGNITINGGTITAVVNGSGAGIGGSGYGYGSGDGGNITINGGTVTAQSWKEGAAIGGGRYAAGGNITINGGTVTASGGSGAGIGGGYRGAGGNIKITGGTVIANSNGAGIDGKGAGIGGGSHAAAGDIIISGGTLTIDVHAAAGIGTGYDFGGSGSNITISGGTTIINSSFIGEPGIRAGTYGTVTIVGEPEVYIWSTGSILVDAGTVRDGEGNDLFYAMFNQPNVVVEGVADGLPLYEYIEGHFFPCGFLPYGDGEITYYATQAGYQAVKGTLNSTAMNHPIHIVFNLPDNISPDITGTAPLLIRQSTPVTITCGEYGVLGTLYMVPKTETPYTSKADLDGVVGRKTTVIYSPATAGSIDTTGLGEGTYQAYLVDSAENVSAPSDNIIIDNTPTNIGSVTPALLKAGTELAAAFNNDYGLEGTLYLVPKTETAYTSKADLEGIVGGKTTVIYSPATAGSLYTTGLAEGTYQAYLADSVGNVSAPCEDTVIDNTATNISSVNPSAMNTGTTVVISFNNDYGLQGTLYLVPKIGTDYTDKMALNGVGGKTAVINSPATEENIDTTGLPEGTYQGYLVDSVGNVSVPCELILDNTAPGVVSVSVPGAGAYNAGRNLDFTVGFTENVIVDTTLGIPSVTINIGGQSTLAEYVSGSGSAQCLFRCTVQAGQEDKDGIIIGNVIDLNGSTVKDATINNAETALKGVPATSGIKVDTTTPVINNAAFTDNTHITIVLNEECTNIAKGNNGGFTVYETGASAVTYAVGSIAQGTDAGHVVLTVTDMGVSGQEGVTVKYSAGENGTIQDLAGNAMVSNEEGRSIAAWDTAAPTVMLSHNQRCASVKQGDAVTITAVFNKGMADTPTISITNIGVTGAAMTDNSGDQRTWTYTWTVPADEVTAAATVQGSDIAGNDYADGYSITFTIDNTVPVVGCGTITASNMSQTGASLSWNKASDLVTAEAGLEYCIYQSLADNIKTVADAEAYGTVKQNYTANIRTSNITGLQPGSTYYFNVVVRDEAGNRTCYTSTTLTTPYESHGHSSAGSGNITTTTNNQSVIIQATPTLNSSTGTAAVAVSEETLNNALSGTAGNAIVEVPQVSGAKAYETNLPADAIASATGKAIEIRTEFATVTVPSIMLTAEAAGNAASAALTVSMADTTKLPGQVQAQIGSKPVIELSLKLDGRATSWNNPDAPVTVTVPFKPTIEELADPEHITVWYIDGAGNAVSVPSGRYDLVTGTVRFSTTHFSKFAVVYVTKTFKDSERVVWARKQIEILASKDILKGKTDTEYAPQTNITRADFLYFLVRTLGIDAKVDGNFDDIYSDAYNYKEIGIAKKLGITSGTGNNKFSPDASLTRQDMMVLTDWALRILKKLEVQGIASDLDKFSDTSLVAAYAVNGVASVVKEGLIVGSGDKVNPLGNTTRAEAAVFLYRLYNKY